MEKNSQIDLPVQKNPMQIDSLHADYLARTWKVKPSLDDERMLRQIRALVRIGKLPSVDYVGNVWPKISDQLASDLHAEIFGVASAKNKITVEQMEALKIIDEVEALEIEERINRAPMTVAERVHAHVARGAEIGELHQPFDIDRRASCKYDLLRFGIIYCGCLLKHQADERMQDFIFAMQSTVINGGRLHIRMPRGAGKTAWVKIAIIWAIVYGHREYVVVFAARGDLAKSIIDDVWSVAEKSEELYEDFPEVCVPIRHIDGVRQRCSMQTYNGKKTRIKYSTSTIRFAAMEGTSATGGILVSRGVQGATRGLTEMQRRPDFVFFDDIQTRKTAQSARLTQALCDFVTQDAMGLSGHDRVLSAVMASTPIFANDLSDQFADENTHPEWITKTYAMVLKWSRNDPAREMVTEFVAEWVKDKANRDENMTLSCGYYLANRAVLEEGVEMLDREQYDHDREISAFHHALNLIAANGWHAFNSEYQMQTAAAEIVVQLNPDQVCRKLNRVDFARLPVECHAAVAYCDINGEFGMRWGVMGVGRGRIAAMMAYGCWPRNGRLHDVNATEDQIDAAVIAGIIAVCEIVKNLQVRNAINDAVQIEALCFDGGWRTAVTAQTIATITRQKRYPFKIIWSKGSGWKTYKPYTSKDELRNGVVSMGEHCHLASGRNGNFLSIHSDYWREVMQRAWLAAPLTKGSLSLWGTDHAIHYDFAREVCAERLKAKFVRPDGITQWDWDKRGENHYGDVATGCIAVASWYRHYDATQVMAAAEIASSAPKQQAVAIIRNAISQVKKVNRYAPRFVKKHGQKVR